MKHIKNFELFETVEHEDSWRSKYYDPAGPEATIYDNTEDSLKNYKYKIGDYVRVKQPKDFGALSKDTIFEITAIDLGDPFSPYRLCSINDDKVGTWIHDKNLISVSDYEVTAIKYNL